MRRRLIFIMYFLISENIFFGNHQDFNMKKCITIHSIFLDIKNQCNFFLYKFESIDFLYQEFEFFISKN